MTVDDTTFSSCTPLLGTSSSGAIYTGYTNNTINIVDTSVSPPTYFTTTPFADNTVTNSTIVPT